MEAVGQEGLTLVLDLRYIVTLVDDWLGGYRKRWRGRRTRAAYRDCVLSNNAYMASLALQANGSS